MKNIHHRFHVLLGNNNLYELALKRDIFFHHPYESFEPIVDFIREAADDQIQ